MVMRTLHLQGGPQPGDRDCPMANNLGFPMMMVIDGHKYMFWEWSCRPNGDSIPVYRHAALTGVRVKALAYAVRHGNEYVF
jgi:hypothetical protein